jgi:RHS repeat-associated protein
MRWIRFGRMHSETRAGRRVSPTAGSLAMRGVCALVVSLVAVLALGAASASAESLCTDTWVGTSEGAWQAAEDWSTGEAPTSTSVACIGSGKTVDVTEGTNHTGVVQGAGTLTISGGSLEVANALEVSDIARLTLTGGALGVAGNLEVSSSLSVNGGPTISGSGSLIVQSGATGTFGSGACSLHPLLSGVTFVNEGTVTMGAGGGTHDGAIEMVSARLENMGTFNDDSYDNGCGFGFTGSSLVWGGGTVPSITNTGTFQSEFGTGNEAKISASISNEGTISAQSGTLSFTEGGSSAGSIWSSSSGAAVALASGSFELMGEMHSTTGALTIAGASVTATSLHGSGASVSLTGGSLNVSSGASSIGALSVTGGTLSLTGELNATSSLSVDSGPTISGPGSLIVQSGATGTFGTHECSLHAMLNTTLVNEGTITMGVSGGTHDGAIDMASGANLENKGTFNDDSYDNGCGYGLTGDSIGYGGGAASITNSGTFRSELGSGNEANVGVSFANGGTTSAQSGTLDFTNGGSGTGGTWSAASGAAVALVEGSFELTGETHITTGTIAITKATVTATNINGSGGKLSITKGSLSIPSGVSTIGTLSITGGTLSVTGNLAVTSSLLVDGESTISGSGSLIVKSGATGTFGTYACSMGPKLTGVTFLNEGTVTMGASGGTHDGAIEMENGARLENVGTFHDDSYDNGCGYGFTGTSIIYGGGTMPTVANDGVFQSELGSGNEARVNVDFANEGSFTQVNGKLVIEDPVTTSKETQWGEPETGSTTPGQIKACAGDPVSCATGNDTETQTDFAIGGRGVGLNLTRTYNSQAAAEGIKGAFGEGWSNSFGAHLTVEKANKKAILHQANGATVTFTEGSGESFTAPASTQDVLSGSEGSGYTLTIADQTKYKFAGSSGRLESVTDRDGNAMTLSYNEAGELTTITDPVSRTIKLKYNGEGLVESAEDPMKHVVKYTYESGNLKSVTQPAEESLRWQFKYDGSHRMTEMVDGRSGKTINEYNGSNQVTKQEDPAGHKLKFEYEIFHTKITNENTGSVTNEYFTSNDEPSSITRGYGTASETTESFAYNEGGYATSVADGNGHTTKYGYDSAGDRTNMIDPDNDETKWTYDSTHDVETMTTPKGETTTIKREAHGNPEAIERPAPESKTQVTKYKYKTTGELESVENPLNNVWKYEYDTKGDRTAEIDPATDKRTWEYNEDSQETATVSPRGNIKEGKPAEFTTKIERDAQGRAIKVTDPLSHVTEYKYDGDGNVETVTDGNKHKTKYTYNGDNEPIKVEAPNKAVTETEYNGAGQVIKQNDANKHATDYKRNVVGEVAEVVNALGKKTLKEYDEAGNLVKLTDPKSRTTTYTYDQANRLTEVSYSSGKPATAKYEYDKDGDRTKMVDGTGTTKYTYDQLDRQTESENGHKEVLKYEYDLADDETKVTYPNKKAVTRAFDKDGRLEKLTDWLTHATKFTYNEDSDLKAIVFPSETKDEDTYAYNDADQMSEVKMKKSTEVLASLVYTRDSDGQVKKITSKGLPGAEVTENTYDENNRLTKYGSTEYKYDSTNNPTKEGSSTNAFNEGDELEKGTGTTYAYDELGERTKTTPEKGGATTYGYDQTGNLTSVERPEIESVPKIEDNYSYDGNSLRASQTISGTTTYFAWDMTEELPLILSDGTNSYIYGPGGLPVEQISGAETPTYLHHDQQGSIRLLTGSAGTVTGKCTYSAYGTSTCEGASTTPLGFDGQYTSSDTGLIYLRARTYDPSTAQFLSIDPLVAATETPYGYAAENPLAFGDPTGFFSLPLIGSISDAADSACGVTFEVPGLDAVTCGAAAAATAYVAAKTLSETIKYAAENTSSTSPEVAVGEPEVEEGESCPVPRRSLPREGEPNSTEAFDRGNGSGQIRDYGPDGLPERDFDFGHDHGFGDPHAHDWIDGVRQPGHPIGPNE